MRGWNQAESQSTSHLSSCLLCCMCAGAPGDPYAPVQPSSTVLALLRSTAPGIVRLIGQMSCARVPREHIPTSLRSYYALLALWDMVVPSPCPGFSTAAASVDPFVVQVVAQLSLAPVPGPVSHPPRVRCLGAPLVVQARRPWAGLCPRRCAISHTPWTVCARPLTCPSSACGL